MGFSVTGRKKYEQFRNLRVPEWNCGKFNQKFPGGYSFNDAAEIFDSDLNILLRYL